MERLTSGTTLNKAMQADPALDDVEIFCNTALVLHGTGATLEGIPPILRWSQSFAEWDQETDNRLPVDWVNDAVDLYKELAKSQKGLVLLHGDLHHDNILFDKAKAWLAIDPKGVVGEPAFEAAAFLRNPMTRLDEVSKPDIVRARVDKICSLTGWDRARVYAWAYCQNFLSAVWDAQNGKDIGPMIGLLKTLRAFL